MTSVARWFGIHMTAFGIVVLASAQQGIALDKNHGEVSTRSASRSPAALTQAKTMAAPIALGLPWERDPVFRQKKDDVRASDLPVRIMPREAPAKSPTSYAVRQVTM